MQLNVFFVDRTLENNLQVVHQQGEEQLAGIDETLGSGVCAADFNKDLWTDLFFVNGSGQTRFYGKQYWWQSAQGNALYINEQGQGFHDETKTSGLNRQIWGMGCLASDFDNDGDIDLLVTAKNSILLYQNNGKGEFVDVSQNSGIAGNYWSTSAAAADFNGDGLLDIYIGNYIDFNKGNKTYEANSQFALEKKQVFNSALYNPQPNRLYQNLGNLKFKEVTAQKGILDTDGRTLDVSWQYLNNDLLPDLFISNDRGTGSNMSLLNQASTNFVHDAEASGTRSASGSRGIASGNLLNDENNELVLASPTGENTLVLSQNLPDDKQQQSSTHYHDLARETGIAKNEYLNLSAWSPIIQDFNNDGFNDLFIASGQTEPDPDAPRVTLGQPKQLLLNSGQNTFYDATRSSGIALQDKQSARGAVYADFDNDGDVDLYISHNNDLGQYLQNESPKRHWLGLKLVGTKSNRDAIGSRVRLITENGVQIRTISSGEGFLSDSDKRLIFGLADKEKNEKIIVQWPDGYQQTFQNIKPDHYWQIEEGNPDIQLLPIKFAGNKQKLRLKTGADKVETRIQYVKLLKSFVNDDNNTQQEFIGLSEDQSPLVRLEVIRALSDNKSSPGLKLLIHSLEDKELSNVIVAIKSLQFYEEEVSIRWLLRLFSHQDPAVKIAVADCFGFFFQEEEAVVHRKYLSLPYLIDLLDDSDSNVRIAAARALANAEKFRGVHALLSKLDDPDVAVRAEVVRTLGLIRQRISVPALWRLVFDNSQSPEVIANAFIALKRLGENSVTTTLNSFVQGQADFTGVPVSKRLEVIVALLAGNEDSTVFDNAMLKQLVEYLPVTNTESNDETLKRIAIFKFLSGQNNIGWLIKQTQNNSARIRLSAFQAMFAQGQIEHVAVLHAALQDKDDDVLQWAVKELLLLKVSLSVADYQKILLNPITRKKAIQFWTQDKFFGDSKLLEIALRLVFASELIPGNTENELEKTSSLVNQVCSTNNPDLQAFCPILVFAENTSEHRQIAIKLLHDQTQTTARRQAILSSYDEQFDSEAINTVYALAQAKKDPLRHKAIFKLFSFNTDSLIDYANKVANNTAEDTEIRFQAIIYLLRHSHPEALQILYR